MAQPEYAQPPGCITSFETAELPPYNPVYLPQYSSVNQQQPLAYVQQGCSPPPAYQNAWSVQVNSFDPDQFQRQMVSTSVSAPVFPICTSNGFYIHNQPHQHVSNRPSASEGCNCCPKKSQECNKSSCVLIVVLFAAVALCMLAAGAYGVYKATKN